MLNRDHAMNIKILYDNEAAKGFRSGWGFSALIDNEILFDTGEDADALLANMHAFGIDPQSIRTVVLSHADWDHAGSAAAIQAETGAMVYAGEKTAAMYSLFYVSPCHRVSV